MINNRILSVLLLTICVNILHAAKLVDVKVNFLPNKLTEVNLQFDGAVEAPQGYVINNPARIALDFINSGNGTGAQSYNVSQGNIQGISFIEVHNKVRVVFNLIEIVNYDVRLNGNTVKIILDNSINHNINSKNNFNNIISSNISTSAQNKISNIDFQRDGDGSGNVIIELNDSNVHPEITSVSGNIRIIFHKTFTPEELRLSLNVIDFATPVQKIKTNISGENTIITIEPKGTYEYLSYQNGKNFIVGFKEISIDDSERNNLLKPKYVGERISYNLSGVPLKDAISVLAEMLNKQIIFTKSTPQESVVNISVKDTPSDQILHLILDNLGLMSREKDGILLIGTKQDFLQMDQEVRELMASARKNEIPITDTIQINYAKASEIIPFLQQICGQNSMMSSSSEADNNNSIKNICIFGSDERTNTLSVTAIKSDLDRVRKEIIKIDIPVQQVMIEARIIESSVNYTKNLGVSWAGGVSKIKNNRGNWISGGGAEITELKNLQSKTGAKGSFFGSPPDQGISFGFLKDGSYLLDLQISAMENTGNGKVISRPKVIASNNKTASISKGTKIPYKILKDGVATTQFLDANLSLNVTPTVTPDGKIILKVTVDKDSPVLAGDDTTVATQNVNSEVIVNDGDTIVLGGIYTDSQAETVDKVPLFGDLPVIGNLFKKINLSKDKAELLIFLTPKIMHTESVSLH